MQSKKSCSAARIVFAIFITLLLALAIVPNQAQAGKFKVLHTFHGKDRKFLHSGDIRRTFPVLALTEKVAAQL
jgi:hypothetical protein